MVVPHDDGPRWFHRKTPLIGTKLWFGPRRAGGWGWAPVSWEGWLLTVVCIGVVLVVSLGSSRGSTFVVTPVAVGALIVVSMLKGTSPGGQRFWREMHGSDGDT